MKAFWIFFVGFLGSLTNVSAKTYEIVVRPKTPALSVVEPGDLNHVKLKFDSQEERDAYLEENSEQIDWEPNLVFKGDAVIENPNPDQGIGGDPLIGNQWSLYPRVSGGQFSTANIDAIRAQEEAFRINPGDGQVIIYVMDSGVNSNPDLEDRLLEGYNALNPSSPPADENGHGTFVSSIAVAKGQNDYGIRGVFPGTIKLVPVRFLNANNEGTTESAANAAQFITRHMGQSRAENPNAKFIVNNSWGGEGYSKFLEDSMKAWAQYGALPITSAGNHGANIKFYPCSFELVANTCVGATDRNDRQATISGWGDDVHVFAPGMEIIGLMHNGTYDFKNGTSMSVPHVVGTAALIWAANPRLSNVDVHNLMMDSVDRLPDARNQSGGRINAYRAVLIATGQDPSLADRTLNSVSGAGSGGGGCVLREENPPLGAKLVLLLVVFGISIFSLMAIARFQEKADRGLRALDRRRNDADA